MYAVVGIPKNHKKTLWSVTPSKCQPIYENQRMHNKPNKPKTRAIHSILLGRSWNSSTPAKEVAAITPILLTGKKVAPDKNFDCKVPSRKNKEP